MVTTAPVRPSEAPSPRGPRLPWITRPLAWRPAVIGLCLAASVAGASLSYDGVLRTWAWLYPVLVVVFATSAAVAVLRLVRAPVVVPSLVGLVAWALALCNMFLRDTAMLGFIPTPQTIDAVREALDEAWSTISFEAVPAAPNVGVVALLTGALGLTALIGEAIGVACRMPAVAGVAPLSVLVVPALLKPSGPGAWGFAISAAAYLAALALARAEAAAGHGAAARGSGAAVSPSRVVVIVAAIVVGALVIPALVPGFDRGSFPEGSRLKYFGQNVGLNPFISLGSDLRSAQGVGIIHYATDSTQPVYLQTVTVDSFDGSTWGPDNRDDQRHNSLDAITPNTAQTAALTATTTVISTGNFTSPYLPSPMRQRRFPASRVASAGTRSTSASRASRAEPRAELRGPLRHAERDRGAARRRALRPARDRPRDLERPGGVPNLVRTTAESVTKGAASQYEKALAIQAYLRTFTYSEQAPVQDGYDGTGMDVLEKFLEKKSGYCIHFSAAMAVMARLVGIPSRIAVGFAPGHPTGGTVAVAGVGSLPEYQVDARDAHAWPELYFEGLGWIPFEPTPSRGVLPPTPRRICRPGEHEHREPQRRAQADRRPRDPCAVRDAAGHDERGPVRGRVGASGRDRRGRAPRRRPPDPPGRRPRGPTEASAHAGSRRCVEELEALGFDHGIPRSPRTRRERTRVASRRGRPTTAGPSMRPSRPSRASTNATNTAARGTRRTRAPRARR